MNRGKGKIKDSDLHKSLTDELDTLAEIGGSAEVIETFNVRISVGNTEPTDTVFWLDTNSL